MNSKSGKISKVLHFIAGITAALIILELFYQATEISLPYHSLSSTSGKRMIPSKRINYFDDGFYLGQSNIFGYIGPAYPPEKPAHVKRVALIGDSYTEGFHIFEKYHFRTRLENRLNKDRNSEWQVLNFGIGNYNFNDMFIHYLNHIRAFKPDYLVFIVSEDDFYFRENFIPSPLLELDGDKLVIDTSFVESSEYLLYSSFSLLFENSAVVKSISNAYKISRREVVKEILFDKLYTADPLAASEYSSNLIAGEIDTRIEKALDTLKNKNVVFLFKREIPDYLATVLYERGFVVDSPQSLFNTELRSRDMSPNYWQITGSYGHWNHNAQPLVAETIYDAIMNYE